MALRPADRLEYATALDPSRNDCLWDHGPAPPAEDKFRSINLLLQSFDHAAVAIDQVLPPELRECHTLCVANKQRHDCIDLSGVNVDPLMHCLERLRYPRAIRDFVALHRQRLDHLLFDVGFDYRSSGGRLQVLKSGYYGVF